MTAEHRLGQNTKLAQPTTVNLLNQAFKLNQISLDYCLQRNTEQWKKDERDNLIVTVILNQHIPSIIICEEDGISYVVDGKQRLTYIDSYCKNAFALGKNIEIPFVDYRDANGDDQTFDLRGKRYSDLPNELQYMINSCPIEKVQYLDCTSEDTAYHFRRYNRGHSLNTSQMAITYTEDKAAYVKRIADSRFFKDCGNYNNKKNDVDKVIMDSYLVTFHIDNWVKDAKKQGVFINQNATKEEFETLENYFSLLEPICQSEDENGLPIHKFTMEFDRKNTFVFIALFHEFQKLGLGVEKFGEFLYALESDLMDKELEVCEEVTTFAQLNALSGTKDKSVITKKIKFLTKLMKDFLNVQAVKVEVNNDKNNELDFVQKVVSKDATEEDVNFAMDLLEDYFDNCIPCTSKLVEHDNTLSMIAIVVYAEQKQIELDDWLTDFANKNNMFMKDQRRNYQIMKESLDSYMMSHAA